MGDLAIADQVLQEGLGLLQVVLHFVQLRRRVQVLLGLWGRAKAGRMLRTVVPILQDELVVQVVQGWHAVLRSKEQ